MRIRFHIAVATLLSIGMHGVAMADDQKLFAAPSTSAPVSASTTGSMAQATLALLVVLVAIFGAAWALRRLRRFSGGGGAAIEVISQAALGAKERAVLIKVSGTHVLIGVAPGRVNVLHVLPADAVITLTSEAPETKGQAAQTINAPSFKSLLKQSLGIK
jgi:flagellar protein FliO/FliZ